MTWTPSEEAAEFDRLTEADIEAGRLLFAGECSFVAASNSMSNLAPMARDEVAFAGRSNVGKSSLVNALTGRKTLARTSQTPGRTRQLIFFNLANRLDLVDLPGYGYASAPKADIEAWSKLTRKYLAGRQTLQRVMLLVDCRRGIGKADKLIMDLLDEAAVSWALVMTKADKLKAEEVAKAYAQAQAETKRHVAAFPHVFLTSSRDGRGIAELRAHLARLASPAVKHLSS
ncbi:MAG: ribosome biogenesis GTP-binding protein YihA/YsxC [Candidatus Puniceispirillaceae bacterium]